VTKPEERAVSGTNATPETLLTGELLQRAKNGDRVALDHIMARYLPRLERWASGRLPSHARSLLDTGDLVQETLMRVLQGLDRIAVGEPGTFQAYVRQAVLNRVRDQIRWAARRPGADESTLLELPAGAPSPLDEAIGSDVLERFEAAMAKVSEPDRQLLHLRIELQFDYDEIAAMTAMPSRDAARMAVRRALRRLAEEMGSDD
jgi:RNA polymerase sigma-70 factor (ECF subfamily)